MATNHTESQPTNINERAKNRRTDSGLNPGSFAAYLSDAPTSASFEDVARAYKAGVDPVDVGAFLDDEEDVTKPTTVQGWSE